MKPRASFWNEMKIFTDSHTNKYQGDGRTLASIASELRLSDQTIEAVQRDADKPDKVAMNVWRHLYPSVADKVFVNSIKNVPKSTLKNIYGK